MSDIPTAIWDGTFTVFGVELKCFVLDNGKRIIEAESMAALFEAMGNGSNDDPGDLADYQRWQTAQPPAPAGEG